MVDKDRLKLYRELNNYEIKYVAKKLKCPRTLIREWEEGIKEIDDKYLDKICGLYNIEKEDLYYKEEKKNYIHLLAITAIIIASSLTLFIHNSIVVTITNILIGINIYFSTKHIIKHYSKEERIKSLFNIELSSNKKSRIKTYLIESSLVSSIYILITNICRIFEIDILVINIYLFEMKSVNTLFIMMISYLLLLLLTFIIELGFGEYMIKRGNENGRE